MTEPQTPRRPTRADLLACAGRTLPDVIAAHLDVLFCGINPGLYTAWSGHHFARPGNRFWPALHRSGFTPRQLHPSEQDELPRVGLGITNVVPRATAAADELTREQLEAGGRRLVQTVSAYEPRVLAVLGVTAYRTAFADRRDRLGRQDQRIGTTTVWVLPNPSGLNAHHTVDSLAGLLAELRSYVRQLGSPRG